MFTDKYSADEPACVDYVFNSSEFRKKFGSDPTEEAALYLSYMDVARLYVENFKQQLDLVARNVYGCLTKGEIQYTRQETAKSFLLSMGPLAAAMNNFQTKIVEHMTSETAPKFPLAVNPAPPTQENLCAFTPPHYFMPGDKSSLLHSYSIFLSLANTWQLCNQLLKSMFERCALDPQLVSEIICAAVDALRHMARDAQKLGLMEDALGGEKVVGAVWGFGLCRGKRARSPEADGADGGPSTSSLAVSRLTESFREWPAFNESTVGGYGYSRPANYAFQSIEFPKSADRTCIYVGRASGWGEDGIALNEPKCRDEPLTVPVRMAVIGPAVDSLLRFLAVSPYSSMQPSLSLGAPGTAEDEDEEMLAAVLEAEEKMGPAPKNPRVYVGVGGMEVEESCRGAMEVEAAPAAGLEKEGAGAGAAADLAKEEADAKAAAVFVDRGEDPTITWKQFHRVVKDLALDQRGVEYEPRESLPISFLEPGCDIAGALVETVERLWEEDLPGRKEGVPDLVVYGIVKPTEEFKGTAWMAKVFNPERGEYEAHFFSSKQGFSHMVGFGKIPMLVIPPDSQWTVMELMAPTVEHGFQFAKASAVPTRQGRQAMRAALLAKTPVEALRATGKGKLEMKGNHGPTWDLRSASVLRRFVMANLMNPKYFALHAKVVRFCKEVLGVPVGQLYLHEATDHPVYAVNMQDGENPLKDRATFCGAGGARHAWKGQDVAGKIWTEAALLVAKCGCDYDTMVKSPWYHPERVEFKVEPWKSPESSIGLEESSEDVSCARAIAFENCIKWGPQLDFGRGQEGTAVEGVNGRTLTAVRTLSRADLKARNVARHVEDTIESQDLDVMQGLYGMLIQAEIMVPEGEPADSKLRVAIRKGKAELKEAMLALKPAEEAIETSPANVEGSPPSPVKACRSGSVAPARAMSVSRSMSVGAGGGRAMSMVSAEEGGEGA